jgi:hypothetical protein
VKYTVDYLVNEYLKDDLIELAKYYDVEFKSYWTKTEIAEAIVDYDEEDNDEVSQMSVRVKRIYEQNKER